jgi:hypothetical protein
MVCCAVLSDTPPARRVDGADRAALRASRTATTSPRPMKAPRPRPRYRGRQGTARAMAHRLRNNLVAAVVPLLHHAHRSRRAVGLPHQRARHRGGRGALRARRGAGAVGRRRPTDGLLPPSRRALLALLPRGRPARLRAPRTRGGHAPAGHPRPRATRRPPPHARRPSAAARRGAGARGGRVYLPGAPGAEERTAAGGRGAIVFWASRSRSPSRARRS